MATIYALTCSVNGFAYVGVTTAKLSKRFREHRCLCRSGKHHAPLLAADWGRFGESAFTMVTLEEAEYSHRGAHCEAEQKWIDTFASQGKLYNAHARSSGLGDDLTRKGIEASRTAVGNRWSAEANAKRRSAQLGKPKGHGAKISAAKQAKKFQAMR